MPDVIAENTPPDQNAAPRKLDRRLIAVFFLCPLAVLSNTIVGFSVSHWVCNVGHKATDYLVCICDFALCGLAAYLAYTTQRRLPEADMVTPEDGRRRFMAQLGLGLAAFCAVIILAGTLATVTLHPCD